MVSIGGSKRCTAFVITAFSSKHVGDGKRWNWLLRGGHLKVTALALDSTSESLLAAVRAQRKQWRDAA